jgi:14-3-3 protein epsilon
MANLETKFDLKDFSSHWGDDKRKDLVFLARTAEAAERYDDMCKCMRALVEEITSNKLELSVDERNLLSVAYKNVIGARRASWRTLNAESQDEKNAGLIGAYKAQVETELTAICEDVLQLLENQLIQKDVIERIDAEFAKDGNLSESTEGKATDASGEAQVFYLKMAGDYFRYLAEAVTRPKYETSAADYYKQAFELSEKVLEPTHPIRLGLALNYSVCYYEILKDKKKACQLAKDAFDEAISKLDKLEEADYKDSTLIMQLLRDNLTLWTSTDGDDDADDNGGGD